MTTDAEEQSDVEARDAAADDELNQQSRLHP
jgi:hypothetical protein